MRWLHTGLHVVLFLTSCTLLAETLLLPHHVLYGVPSLMCCLLIAVVLTSVQFDVFLSGLPVVGIM